MNTTPLLVRFLRYVGIYSQSSSKNADNGIIPSTPQQFDFAQLLAEEMRALPLTDVCVTDNCYVYGRLPATPGSEDVAPFCLLSHMDTVEEVSGKDVKPLVHEQYDGMPIQLAEGRILDPADYSELALAGKNRETVITSDGTTLLGADDKAGIAEIMTAIAFLVSHPAVPHPDIEIIFSPDEETGHGMDKVPLELLHAQRAYTVDGGHIGELEVECFNAYGTTVTFTGKSVHTGTARAGGLINALLMVSAFVRSLPPREAPETTDGAEGFYAPMEINGTIERATVTLLLRDFTDSGIERRKKVVDELAQAAALSYGGTAKVVHKKQYQNMKAVLDAHPAVVKDLIDAYHAAGVTPVFTPIRGGTDGSRLTEMGIPTPNIFTGGHNFHSRYEWASLEQMQKAVDVLIALARIGTEQRGTQHYA
ncbi:MAG: peptidase T [Treponema sp.]|nr:peptidase T [Treponema sp.]